MTDLYRVHLLLLSLELGHLVLLLVPDLLLALLGLEQLGSGRGHLGL